MVLLKSHRWGRALFDDGRGRLAPPGRKLQVVKRSLLARRLLLRGLFLGSFLASGLFGSGLLLRGLFLPFLELESGPALFEVVEEEGGELSLGAVRDKALEKIALLAVEHLDRCLARNLGGENAFRKLHALGLLLGFEIRNLEGLFSFVDLVSLLLVADLGENLFWEKLFRLVAFKDEVGLESSLRARLG